MGGPFLSTSWSNEPRDKKQLYNRLYQLIQTPNFPVNKENNDKLLQIRRREKNGIEWNGWVYRDK